MATASPSPAATDFDLNDAFAYVFRSPNWIASILLGALCSLASFLVIPSWILYGYMIQTSRNVRAGNRALPSWDSVGRNIVDGLLYTIALLLWFLPIVVLVVIGAAASGCTSATDTAGAPTTSCANAGAIVAVLVAVVYALLVAILHPAIYAQYLAAGFGGAFQVPEILARVGRRVGLTFFMIVVGIIASIVALLGLIALIVGVFVTAPYAQFVLANAYGQYARLTDPPGVVTS
jgi:hypothetical protein